MIDSNFGNPTTRGEIDKWGKTIHLGGADRRHRRKRRDRPGRIRHGHEAVLRHSLLSLQETSGSSDFSELPGDQREILLLKHSE